VEVFVMDRLSPKSLDDEVHRLLLEGRTPHAVSRVLGVDNSVAYRVERERMPEAFAARQGRPALRARQHALIAESAALMTVKQMMSLPLLAGMSEVVVRRALHVQGLQALPYVRPVKVKPPVLRVVKTPKPAPIKRSKAKPPKRDPLFLTCSRKHPITKSNRVKGTLNECLVCKRRGVSLPPNLVAARDVLIAELEAVIAREVAEFTADLRPEMEEAA
jgi:hypothetical protein